MRETISPKNRNKIFKGNTGVASYYLKIDDNGDVGFSSNVLRDWDDKNWRCGFHNHWTEDNLETMNLVYEYNPSLENK